MKFMDDNFLLYSKEAQTLYHDYAADMPIFDFHNHLNVKEIAEDISYENITKVWLGGDHYKWRIMRATGAPEKNITGNGSDRDKFDVYVQAVEKSINNPLYHWSHLELRRFFQVNETISSAYADVIYDKSREVLKDLSARKLITMSNVHTLCTTDDPADTLQYHAAVQGDASVQFNVLPSFRPDKAVKIYLDGFREYIKQLAQAADMEIHSFDDLKSAIKKRMDHFDAMGCVVSDHGLDTITFCRGSEKEVDKIFRGGLFGRKLSAKEVTQYQTELLIFLGTEYRRRNWVMQIHVGAIRNNNQRMFNLLGPDTGFDASHDEPVAAATAGLLNAIEMAGGLPKTVLYCLNPKDYYSLITIGGCFNGEVPGKVQFGPAWWFIDHLDGMEKQLRDISSLGSLGYFIGMLTDSRSFLSFPRHEYFRRILCNFMGDLVAKGQIPWDEAWLGQMVKDICFNNARDYFQKG